MTLLSIRPLGIAAALFVAAGLAAGPVSAQQGSVAGQVTDKSNQQPVAGAAVLVGGTSLQARTGREGRYSLTNVAPGRYQVQVRFIGFATATQTVTVAFTTFVSAKRVTQMRDWTKAELQTEPQLTGLFIFAELPKPLEPQHLLFDRRWYTLTSDQSIALLEG